MAGEVEVVEGEDLVVVVLLWSGRGLLLLLLLLGAAANSLALLAFCRGPGLRTLSNRFVMNLLVVNLAACSTLLPLLLLDSATCEQYNHVLCAVSEGVAAGYCTASILGVLLIAMDQYYAVVDPLRYHSKVDAVRSAAMLAVAWLCALLAGALGALEPRGAGLWASCGQDQQAAGSLYRRIYSAAFAILVFVIPFAALCWIYVSIYGAAHRNSQRTRRNGSGSVAPPTPPPELSCSECRSLPATPSGTLGGLAVSRSAPSMETVAALQEDLLPSRRSSLTSAAGEAGGRRSSCPHAVTVPISPPVRSASAWLVSSLRCRISNASLFRYREEGRAARVSAIVVVMALGCWAPYVAVLVLHAALPPAALPRHLDALVLAALAAAVCISPCLFAFRNRRVQKEVRRMLCGLCPRGSKGSQERSRRGGGAAASKAHLHAGHSGSARRLLPHNLMASLAEDCTPSDSLSVLSKVTADDASIASNLTVSVSVPLWTAHLLPDDALTVETARSSFSSGASSSQGSALSTDTADE